MPFNIRSGKKPGWLHLVADQNGNLNKFSQVAAQEVLIANPTTEFLWQQVDGSYFP